MPNPAEQTESHVIVQSRDDNAVSLLHRATGISKQKIKSAMTKGAVWLSRGRRTQRLRRATRTLRPGDELHLYYNAKVLAEEPVAPGLIADNGVYSVWNKPCGLRSQGSKWGDHCTITRWAEKHLRPERPALTVHRLDRAASGLILVAHSKAVAAKLSSLFRNREIEKRYRAVVEGAFPADSRPVLSESEIDGKSAMSEVSLVGFDGANSIVDVRIETGRKHQVRIHLAELGFPIVGDRLHGNATSESVDLQLVACWLKFPCPVTGLITEYRLPT